MQQDDEIFSFIQSNPLLGSGVLYDHSKIFYFTDSFWRIFGLESNIASSNDDKLKENIVDQLVFENIAYDELLQTNIVINTIKNKPLQCTIWIKKKQTDEGSAYYFVAITRRTKLSKINRESHKKEAKENIDTYVLLEELVDASDDIVFLKDDQLRYILFNEALCKFLNLSRKEIFLKKDEEIMPLAMATNCQNSDRIALEKKVKNYLEESSYLDRIIETKKFAVLLKNGKFGVGAIIRDITVFKEKQREIESSQSLLINLTQQLEVVVCQVEVEKNGVQHWNFVSDQVKNMLDLTPQDIYNDPSLILKKIHHEDQQEYIKSATYALVTSTTLSIEVRITDKNGKWVHILAKPETKLDESTTWYCTITDISKRKKIEKESKENELLLKKSYAELNSKKEILISVARATNELLHNADLDDAICKTVAIMSEGTKADQGFYFKMQHTSNDFYANHYYEWYPNEKPPLYQIKKLQKIPRNAFPEAWNSIEKGNIYQTIIRHLDDNVPHKKVFTYNGVKSTIFIPVVVNGKSIAIIGFDDCTTERVWTEYEIAILRTLANSISHAKARDLSNQNFDKIQDLLDTASSLGKIGAWEYSLPSKNITWTEMTRRIHEVNADYNPTIDSAMDFYEADTQILLTKYLDNAIKYGTPWDIEAILTTAKKNKIWVRTIGQAEFTNGICTRLYGSIQDINDEKKLKISLAKSTKEYNELINIIPVGIFRFSEDNVMRYVSSNWCKMTGQTVETVVNRPLSAYKNVHPDDKLAFENAIQKSIIDKKSFQLESRFTVNGVVRWMRLYAEPQKTANGNYEWVGVQVDITDNKNFEQKLIENNKSLNEAKNQAINALRQYAEILDSQSVFFIKTDIEGRYTYINDYYNERFGNGEELIGQLAMKFIIPEDQEMAKNILGQCITSPNQSQEIIIRKYNNKGEIVACKWEVKSIAGSANHIKEIQCMGFDITEQIENLEELKKLLELTSDQNQRLNSFAHIVSHNIRSHSANFSGILQLLDETQDTDEKSYYIELLNQSATQLDQTIRNLNEVLSVSIKLEKQLSPKNLYQEIQNSLQILSGELRQNNVEILLNVDKDTKVNVVPAYLDSILLNLASNAIKFRATDRQLTISYESYFDNGYIVLVVKDNGQGLDLERYGHKVFGLYNTFHANKESKGFGLYITKNQIEAMGGKIKLTSKVNGGARFEVYFKK